MFKNKRYWILMPPFFLFAVLLGLYLPNDLKPYIFLIVLLFWVIYYSWSYFDKKRIKT
jgi:hypothetical protein